MGNDQSKLHNKSYNQLELNFQKLKSINVSLSSLNYREIVIAISKCFPLDVLSFPLWMEISIPMLNEVSVVEDDT